MRSLLSFCQGLPERTYEADEILLHEGERTGVLYVLIEGQVAVLKGDVLVTTVSEPGAIFGEMSVLLDSTHTATVKALSSSRVYVIEHASIFLQSHTDIAYQLAKLLAQRLYGVTTYLVDLKTQFEDQQGHLGMVDEVLGSLVHQQDEECAPGSGRDPSTAI
ncbi:MAG: Crp/Fnr family transcriptional regulator [Candidatus Binatia bacterium]